MLTLLADDLVPKMPPLMPASMWTRKDMKVFKDNVRKNPDNVIKIGSLATATVSPPPRMQQSNPKMHQPKQTTNVSSGKIVPVLSMKSALPDMNHDLRWKFISAQVYFC